MARRIRWFGLFLLGSGIIVVSLTNDPGVEFLHFLGLGLIFAGVVAFAMSFFRWDRPMVAPGAGASPELAPVSSDVFEPIRCPRDTGKPGSDHGASQLTDASSDVPVWAEKYVPDDILLSLDAHAAGDTEITIETYTCPVCKSRSIYLVRHSLTNFTRVRIGVALSSTEVKE